MEEFNFSRLPNCIEEYECFYNPATGYVTGEELKEIKKNGDETAKKKWLYFYPVDRNAVGRPQKLMIFYEEAELFYANCLLKDELKSLVIGAIACGVLTIGALFIWAPLALVILGFFGFLGMKYFFRKFKLEKQISQIERHISALKREIEHLLSQVEVFGEAEDIEHMLKDEVKKLELKAIGETVSEDIDNESQMDKYIKSQRTDKYFGVRSLLIDGWGIMQPFKIKGVGGEYEKTGLHRILEDLEKRAFAVSLDSQQYPIFRAYYFQFIFLLEKNINVASFFYDFVKRQRYGKKLETFQYPHITNFSIRESEMDESQIKSLGQLMRSMVDNLEMTNAFLKQDFQSFSLTVASGSHFKCVLVDEVVRNGLNKWFEAIDSKKEILNLDPNDRALREKFMKVGSDGKKEVDEEKLKEYIEKKQKEMKDEIKLYRSIQKDYENVSKAREAIKEVKSGVERFAR